MINVEDRAAHCRMAREIIIICRGKIIFCSFCETRGMSRFCTRDKLAIGILQVGINRGSTLYTTDGCRRRCSLSCEQILPARLCTRYNTIIADTVSTLEVFPMPNVLDTNKQDEKYVCLTKLNVGKGFPWYF